MKKSNGFRTPSWTSPKGGNRGCLCDDNRYSIECCDGNLQAQGIGNITGLARVAPVMLQENGDKVLQENNSTIIIENNG